MYHQNLHIHLFIDIVTNIQRWQNKYIVELKKLFYVLVLEKSCKIHIIANTIASRSSKDRKFCIKSNCINFRILIKRDLRYKESRSILNWFVVMLF